MAEEMIEQRGQLLGIPDTPEESTFSDYLTLANPIYTQSVDESLRFSSTMAQPDFKWSNNMDVWNSFSDDEKKVALDSLSVEHAEILVDRHRRQREAEEAISNDSAWVKYPTMLAAGITDPINFIPIGGAGIKLWRAGSTLNRMAEVGLKVGTVGAVSNVASEVLFDVQGMKADYTSAALFGFVLGGGFGAVGEGLSRTMFQKEAARAFMSREVENNIQADNTITVEQMIRGEKPQFKFDPTVEVAKVERSWSAPDLMKSDSMFLWEHESNSVRNFISRIVAPTVAGDKTVGTTAWDKKAQWLGDLNTARVNMATSYRDAKVDGYSGSLDDFNTEVARWTREVAAMQEDKVYSHINQQDFSVYKDVDVLDVDGQKVGTQKVLDEVATNTKRKQAIDKAYSEAVMDIKHPNRHVQKAFEEQQMYYNKMLKRGQDLDMKAFKGLHDTRVYMPRVYDFKTIAKMSPDALRVKLDTALRKHKANADVIHHKDYDIILDDLVENFKGISFDRGFVDYSYVVPKELPLDTYLKARKLKLDEREMSDLLLENTEDIMGLYHYKTSGQMATQWAFGTTDLREIQDTIIAPIRNEVSGDEATMKALERVFQDNLGTLRIPKNGDSMGWRTSRILSAWNASTFGGSFGINTLTELPAALLATGYKGVFIKNFGDIMNGVKEVMFKQGKPDSRFINEMIAMGHMQELLSLQGMNRIADTESVVSAGKIENALMGFTDKLFKWNGMRAITASIEAVVGGNAVMDIVTLARKSSLSVKESNRLKRWGIPQEDLKRLATEIESKAEIDNGHIKALNLHKYNTDDLDMIQTAINRAIESGVVQGNTMHLPNWMISPDPVRRLVFQFLRFPIAAHEILLRRGVQEDKAGLIASALGAMMTYGSITYLREQGEIAAGLKNESDAKYDVFNDPTGDSLLRLVTKSANYAASTGAFTLPINYGATLIGAPELGREYANNPTDVLGPSVGRLEAITDVLNPLLMEGEIDNASQWYSIKSMTPLGNVPFLSEGLSYLVRENTY